MPGSWYNVQERSYGADWDQAICLPVADTMTGNFFLYVLESCVLLVFLAWIFVPGMYTEHQ